MSRPRFTREIELRDQQLKLAVKILPDSNTFVVFSDDGLDYAVTLDPRAAHQLGQALVHASRIAAMNTLDPSPERAES